MAAHPAVHPDPDLDEAREIQEFWEAHYDELLKEFPEQFVAVQHGKVIVAHGDLAMLVYELRDRKLDPRKDVNIQFITAKMGTFFTFSPHRSTLTNGTGSMDRSGLAPDQFRIYGPTGHYARPVNLIPFSKRPDVRVSS